MINDSSRARSIRNGLIQKYNHTPSQEEARKRTICASEMHFAFMLSAHTSSRLRLSGFQNTVITVLHLNVSITFYK